jgi:hypothetical protein
MAIETVIQLTLKSGSPFEAKAKMEHLKAISRLDCEALNKLAELSKSNKAVDQLKSNFGMIQSFLG